MSNPSQESYAEIMNSMTFDLCSDSSVVMDERSYDSLEHEMDLQDGFQTPPTMPSNAEFPPTFIFKTASSTIVDFTSFDEDLYIPQPTESCEETVGSESTTLLPSFLALKLDGMVTEQVSALSYPSLLTVSTGSSDQDGYDADSDRTTVLSRGHENLSTLSNSSAPNQTTTVVQTMMKEQNPLAKKPLSSQHPLQMPRRKSMGAYAA